MGNRDYLLARLRGEAVGDCFLLLDCEIDAAGGIHIKSAREMPGGKGYHICIQKPGGAYELRGGEPPADEFRIMFSEVEAPPVISTADILEAFRRWKASPAALESLTDTGEWTARESWPESVAETEGAGGR